MSKSKSKSWGGKRPGSGPKLKGESPRQRVLITFDPKDLAFLDNARGAQSRGDFIGLLLKTKIKV